jgi:DNA invertase Pin-like site-specific DNA recombinase
MQAHQPKEHPVTGSDTTARRAVIYARISKDRTGAGLGVGKQEDDCRELAARLGLDVVGVRQDNDLTAYKGGTRSKPRPGYQDLLGDIRTGRAQAVLAWHTDRLHRDLTELEAYITACGEGRDGVPTYTVKGGDLDLSTASGRMVARILGAVARQEVEHMIERQKSAHERIRAAGAWKGGPRPFGYRRDGLSVKQGGDGSLAQVPGEAQMLRDGCAKVLAGLGTHTIAKQWNAAGQRTTAGNEWNNVNMRLLLIRAINAGLIEHQGKVIGPANCEPIVDEDTWRAVRAILTDPKRRQGPGPKPRHLLTGVLVCGVCGGHRFRSISSGWGDIYQCASSQFLPGGNGSGPKRWHLARKQEPLDAYVEQIVIEKLGRPDVVAALSKPGVDMAAIEMKRGGLRGRLDELGELFAAGDIDGMQLAAASKPLRAQIDAAERELSEAYRGSALEEFGGSADPATVWDGLGIERKRAVIALLLRVKLLPVGRGGTSRGRRISDHRNFALNLNGVEIQWQK